MSRDNIYRLLPARDVGREVVVTLRGPDSGAFSTWTEVRNGPTDAATRSAGRRTRERARGTRNTTDRERERGEEEEGATKRERVAEGRILVENGGTRLSVRRRRGAVCVGGG